MTWNTWHRLGALFAAGGALAGCGSSTPTSPSGGGGTQVQALASLAFSPNSVGIEPGGSVTWVFGSVGHTVTFDAIANAPTNIGSINAPNANVSISRTFPVAGVYTYHCSIHTFMTGTVVVGTSGVVPPPPPPPPPPPGGGYGIRAP